MSSSPEPLPAQTTERTASSPAITRFKALLRQIIRVTIKDKRIFLGTLVGTDNSLNIILVSTEEYSISLEDGSSTSRYVGQVMIPWHLVTKVEAEAQWEERMPGLGEEGVA
ncbi:hypothetical protein OE88DRAFT_1664881 [Heliocybe sulcata]|uniref:Sm domain-containing protein n=1 Tax=Heliocybe sulcata TaxID=5364 RepID=A0A5C3MSA5_9AGAM|nr:hypothetical protein OE88DRAFT_1664881 [Heliocybe sulcata]